jgi:hypothetical protein
LYYIVGKLKSDCVICAVLVEDEELPADSLEAMANFLKMTYFKMQAADSDLLKSKLKLGAHLSEANERFLMLKRKQRLDMTWKKWIECNTSISFAYAKRMIQVNKLVQEYKGLGNLSISFNGLFRLRNKITTVFERNETIRCEWQNDDACESPGSTMQD